MKTFQFYLVSILIISSVVFGGLQLTREGVVQMIQDGPSVQMGSVLEDAMANLQGPWTFYEGSLYENLGSGTDYSVGMNAAPAPITVMVPHIWTENPAYGDKPFGYGTYRMSLSGFDPEKTYAIYIKDESLAYRLRVNGQAVMESGKVGRTKETYEPYLKSQWTAVRSDMNGNMELAIEIANFDYNRAGFWTTMRIGSFDEVSHKVTREYLAEMFLFASLLVMALIVFAIYFKTRQDQFTLYVGLFAMLVAFRILFTGNRLALVMFPNMPCILSDRIMYLVGYLLLPVAWHMSIALGYIRQNKTLSYIIHALSVIVTGMTLFGSVEMYTGLYSAYQVLVPLTALFFVFLLIYGIKQRRPRAIPTAIAYMFAIAGVANEMFVGRDPYSVGLATMGMIGIFTVIEIDMFYSIKIKKESLETEIQRDRLTGAYNRLYLEQNMDRIIEISEQFKQPVSLILLDLDFFKNINDKYGHDIGDTALIGTIEAVKKAIRGTDHIIRWGGEEFLILANGTNLEGAASLAEKIRATIDTSVFETVGHMTASFGVAEHFSGESKEDWFKRTDLALYSAKNSGRNRVVAWDKGNQLPVQIEQLEWQSKWNCGNEDIDNDHRGLINLSNQLIEASLAEDASDLIEIKIMALLSHIAYHFEREEAMLKQLHYDRLTEHKQKHEALLSEAEKLKLQYSEKSIDIDEFMTFVLGKVVMGHLLFEDSKFYAYTRNERNQNVHLQRL